MGSQFSKQIECMANDESNVAFNKRLILNIFSGTIPNIEHAPLRCEVHVVPWALKEFLSFLP